MVKYTYFNFYLQKKTTAHMSQILIVSQMQKYFPSPSSHLIVFFSLQSKTVSKENIW